MLATLTFLGAAQNVTGSCYLLESYGTRILIDCGMYQERHYLERNWQPFQFDPKSINAVFLTHAHLDHSGLLPKLVRDGYQGKVYCTQATAEIARIILIDAAHLQEEDAMIKAERHRREGRRGPHPEVPLYSIKDAESVTSHFSPVDYMECVKVNNNIEGCYYEAGHVLGAATISINIKRTAKTTGFCFPGILASQSAP